MQPETEPRWLSFEFLAPTPSPASRCRTQDHAAAAISSTPHHHLPPSIPTSVSNDAPKTELACSSFKLLPLNPPPRFVLANKAAHHHHHHHLTHTTPPPPPIIPNCHYTWHTRNRAGALSFVF